LSSITSRRKARARQKSESVWRGRIIIFSNGKDDNILQVLFREEKENVGEASDPRPTPETLLYFFGYFGCYIL
jgi:hypothetical protein